ncbi:MAG: metallophosphoesterase [Candidatus Omnitrophica bacterium]|nr:hypothetical protein [bacterium]NUN98313.1 metallophosphoesterase [Candidatus Omnitrophota bacterium]
METLIVESLFGVAVAATCLGAFLLPLAAVSQGCSRMPDSVAKAGLETGLYTVAGLGPLVVVWLAWVWGLRLFEWEGGRPVIPWATFWYLLAGQVSFVLHTAADLWRWMRNAGQVEGVETVREARPYVSRPDDPRPLLPRWNGIHRLDRIRVRVRIPGLDPRLVGLKIGHLTDFHLGKQCHARYVRHAVDRVLETSPDLIAVTGDFVNFAKYLDECFETLAEIQAPLGVFAVRGNHDYWVGAEEIGRRIESAGMILLEDRTVEAERRGARFLVSGIESRWNRAGVPLDYIPAEDTRLKVVLSHTPDEFPRLAEREPHLVLSGHTHGGQLRLPLFGPVVTPSDYGRRYAAGVFRKGPSLLYVSRGIGCYPPLRLLCDPEVTVFELI